MAYTLWLCKPTIMGLAGYDYGLGSPRVYQVYLRTLQAWNQLINDVITTNDYVIITDDYVIITDDCVIITDDYVIITDYYVIITDYYVIIT